MNGANMKYPIFTLLSLLLTTPLGLAGGANGNVQSGPTPATRPNIIFIMADDLGYGDLGSYGQTMISTPHIDRLAEEGMRFTDAYAQTVCAPARSSLMTGHHNGHGRLRDNIPHGIFLRPDDFTLAELMKQAGYKTGGVGKWSLGNPGSWGVPNYQGFDYYYGHLNQDQAHFYYPDYLWENDQVKLLHESRKPGGMLGNRGHGREYYTQDLFTEKALGFIRKHREDPFFLYLPYTIPHFSDYPTDSPEIFIVPSDAPYSDQNWPQVSKNYAAMITRMDRDVGRIMLLLENLGIDSNTLVFFTSDNGPWGGSPIHSVEFFDSNGPLRGVKRDVYEGGIRVPLIARWPGRISPGQTSHQLVALWDMMPTLAELVGLPVPSGVDGVSVLPTLLDGSLVERDYLYWDYGHVRQAFKQAVRWGKWKGVRLAVEAPLELYDLENDIGEDRNMASSHPEIVHRIETMMEAALELTPDYPIPGLNAPVPGSD